MSKFAAADRAIECWLDAFEIAYPGRKSPHLAYEGRLIVFRKEGIRVDRCKISTVLRQADAMRFIAARRAAQTKEDKHGD